MRICIFISSRNMIHFSLKDLQFRGEYRGIQYAAGIVFFNRFNGTTAKLVELNTYIGSYNTAALGIIGTGSKMHSSVFEYTPFASITLIFSVPTNNRNPFLVGDNHISYSRYITLVPGKLNVFHINQSSRASLKYNVCYKFQFLHIKPSKYTFKFLFPDDCPMLVTGGYLPLYHNALLRECSFVMEGTRLQSYTSKHLFDKEELVSINSFWVEFCGPLQYSYLQIITLPCKIPCPYMIHATDCHFVKHLPPHGLWEDDVTITCDICKNAYIFCRGVHLQSNMSPLIRINLYGICLLVST